MEHNRLGVMGHYYGGMLDVYTDLTKQCANFGGHIEVVEVDQLSALRREVGDADIADRVAAFRDQFDVRDDVPKAELERGRPDERCDGPARVRTRPRLAVLLLHGHGRRAETRTRSAPSSSAAHC